MKIGNGPAAVTGDESRKMPLFETDGKAREKDDPEIRRPASNLKPVFLAEIQGKWKMDPRVKKQGAALRAVEVLGGFFYGFPIPAEN